MTSIETPQRRYVLTKIAPGDYLLPSNDARRLWRIFRYWEDGSLTYEDAKGKRIAVVGARWQLHYKDLPKGMLDPGFRFDYTDWDEWTFWEGPFDSRREAVDQALRDGEPK